LRALLHGVFGRAHFAELQLFLALFLLVLMRLLP
jgi:hypothetical protein